MQLLVDRVHTSVYEGQQVQAGMEAQGELLTLLNSTQVLETTLLFKVTTGVNGGVVG